jgi:hypothetical protein
MNELMTLQEIEEAFDSQWVLVEDPELTAQLEVVSGKVIFHSSDRDELYRVMGELKPKHSAILFTGQASDDLVVML